MKLKDEYVFLLLYYYIITNWFLRYNISNKGKSNVSQIGREILYWVYPNNQVPRPSRRTVPARAHFVGEENQNDQ